METISHQAKPQNGAFLKAMIKINHPEWNAEQIENEFSRQMEAKNNQDDDGFCEACSG